MIAAIGAFDGFHRGHQTLLRRACERAEERGDAWGIVTFGRHPERALGSRRFEALFTTDEQLLLERYFAIPEVCRVDFTREIAAMMPVDFLDYIARAFGVRGIVVGEDFRFGSGRSGDAALLVREGARRGWPVDIMPIYRSADGVPVCSTAVRSAVSEGRIAAARALLGYPYLCLSRVIHGNARGRGLGFPTANVEIPDDKVGFPDGVYATAVRAGGEWRIGAANIGSNPTFSDVTNRRFEVNLLGYEGDLYGREIAVFLLDYLRGEIRFESPAALSAQVKQDSERIARIGETALRDHAAMWTDFEIALEEGAFP